MGCASTADMSAPPTPSNDAPANLTARPMPHDIALISTVARALPPWQPGA